MTTPIAERKKLLKRLKGFRALVAGEIGTLDPDLVARLDDTINALGESTRITIAGLDASGHHNFAGLLAGQALVSSPEAAIACPPLRVQSGATVQTKADVTGRERLFKGCVVDKLIELQVRESIEVFVPTAMVPQSSLSVLPVYDAGDDQSRYLLDMIDDTDLIIWCSDAASPWHPRERRLWFTVPDALRTRSVLVLTGTENLVGDQAARDVCREKCKSAKDSFARILPLSINAAVAAAPEGLVADATRFEESGGRAVLDTIANLALDDALLARARALRAEIDAIPIGAAQPVPEPIAPPRTPGMAERISKGVQECIVACETGEPETICTAMSATLKEMGAALNGGDIQLDRDHETLCSQIDEAADLVMLLSYEQTALATQEGADLLRQIAFDVLDRLPAEESDSAASLRKAS